MKFSTWIAGGALIGKHIASDRVDWKDAVLTAIITKNELVDKDGDIRKILAGKSDNEIEKLRLELNKEAGKSQIQHHEDEDNYGNGFWGGFMRGFKGK